MAFNNYLEDENDKPYFTTNSLAYYYDKMEGFAKAVEGSAKALNLTKEEVEKRLTLYINQNKNELDQRLAQWDGKLEKFDSSVEALLTEWVNDGTLTHVIDTALIDLKVAPVASKLTVTVDEIEKNKYIEVNVLNPPSPYLPAKADGLTDDTLNIQKIIDNFQNIFFPDGTYMINVGKALIVPSNRTIRLSKNATLKAIPSNLGLHYMFSIIGSKNVKIEGGRLLGERHQHIGITGEWGIGILMRDVLDVTVRDMHISQFWGDGIIISKVSTNVDGYSENVLLENLVFDDNRRQGISVASVKGLVMNNLTIRNTAGTPPAAGIDFEPDYNTSRLQGIVVNNLTCINNNYAIAFWFQHIINSLHDVDITINDMKSYDNLRDIRVAIHDNGVSPVNGKITINNAYMKNAKKGSILITDYNHFMPLIEINSPVIIDANTENGNSQSDNNAIAISRNVAHNNVLGMGNIIINNPTVIANSYSSVNSLYIVDVKKVGLTNVEINNPIRIDDGSLGQSWIEEKVLISDKRRILEKNVSLGSAAINGKGYFRSVTNKGATVGRNLTLTKDFPIGSEITVYIEEPYKLSVIPIESEIIGGNGLGKNINSVQVGSRLTIKKISATQFIIVEQVGSWGFEV